MVKKIEFGPITNYASWEWYKDIADYLGASYFTDLPSADAEYVFWVKGWRGKRLNGEQKNILIPIDTWQGEAGITNNQDYLRKFDGFVVNNFNLYNQLERFEKPIYWIEHHNKFAHNTMPEFKEKGFILFIAHCHYIKDLIYYYNKVYCPPVETVILTNWGNSHHLAASGLEKRSEIEGMKVYDWSPELQDKLIQECKYTIDYKPDLAIFKPATKGQQMLMHGTSFACNRNCISFNLAPHIVEPSNFELWGSRSYFELCQLKGKELRDKLSLDAIGNQFLSIMQ